MSKPYNCIGLVGIPRQSSALETHRTLYHWLIEHNYQVLVEDTLISQLKADINHYASLNEIGKKADLAIIIGGDGNMLRSIRYLAHHNIKMIGINRGNLGFLTDISPDDAIEKISQVLAGKYIEDSRFLLEVDIYRDNELIESGFAVNEIVIHPSKVAHMIAFDAYINEQSAFSQRADGLIIASPTGSTAYSLSAGGPILMPQLEAFIITPMFPHSLSARPIVINSDNTIRLKFPTSQQDLALSCDSQVIIPVRSKDELVIKKAPNAFHLIHPADYNYFRNLSTKLGWSQKLF